MYATLEQLKTLSDIRHKEREQEQRETEELCHNIDELLETLQERLLQLRPRADPSLSCSYDVQTFSRRRSPLGFEGVPHPET